MSLANASRIPYGELAPGLYHACTGEMTELLETGRHLDLTDFRNACTSLRISQVNGARAFSSSVFHFAQGIVDERVRSDLYWTMSWLGNNPSLDGVRQKLLIGTQDLADLVLSNDSGEFSDPDERFTRTNWRVMKSVVRDEFDIQFVRVDRETRSVLTQHKIL